MVGLRLPPWAVPNCLQLTRAGNSDSVERTLSKHAGSRPQCLFFNERCSPEEKVSMRFYMSPDAAAAKLPFSQAVQVGDVLYLSGALGHKPGTREVVAGGIEAETRQTMQNIGAVLKANGLSFD